MSNVDAALAANRDALQEFATAAARSGTVWTVPRAPGKWSPSQLVEHVARSIEESAKVVAGAPSKLPSLPFFVRPIARGLLFNRVLRNGAFPKARTNKAMNPEAGPATPAEARARLDAAFVRFEQACRARAAEGLRVESGAFGSVSVPDYARFIEVHTRHHRKQLPS